MRRISTLDQPKSIDRHGGGLGFGACRSAASRSCLRKAASAGRPALRDMHVTQRAGHLGFDDDQILDYQADGIFANDYVVVKDHDSPLLDDAEPGLPHLVGKGISETFSTNP
jgi:hypothetical protein